MNSSDGRIPGLDVNCFNHFNLLFFLLSLISIFILLRIKNLECVYHKVSERLCPSHSLVFEYLCQQHAEVEIMLHFK